MGRVEEDGMGVVVIGAVAVAIGGTGVLTDVEERVFAVETEEKAELLGMLKELAVLVSELASVLTLGIALLAGEVLPGGAVPREGVG